MTAPAGAASRLGRVVRADLRRLTLVDRPSTTRIVLRRLRMAMLVAIMTVLATAYTVFTHAQDTIVVASQRTTQAIMDVSSAEQALREADSAAVHAFAAGVAGLAGPGNEYQNHIALAQLSLQRVAEVNQAGVLGELTLSQVDGQLTAYIAQVEQAHADYASGATQLGLAETLYASALMHAQDGILAGLSSLEGTQRRALADQAASWWLGPRAVLLWGVPAAVLFVLLLSTQRCLARRFRRLINWWLAAATALLVVLCVSIVMVVRQAEDRLTVARTNLEQVVADQHVSLGPISGGGADPAAVGLLNDRCAQGAGFGCGSSQPAAPDAVQAQDAAAATAAAGAAGADYGLRYVIPGLGVVIAVLIVLGVEVRVREYRYEVS
ncbi:hypothetical protein [Gandjariella thermophila]|uniref:Uncharacterized protein n=1 Tax=Gandjariella thermophila TaxID=1931992 RepID=A0A4D4JCC8_9PSEU|nr:hypothetical protein [Gandjariella thermophila]GDY32660.1 hypothetical protein GTS_42930 [Gandjariella thermophila]